MRELKVVIADDHPVVLLGLREMIQRDEYFTLAGEALSSSQLVEQLQLHQPELLITDFNMPGDDIYGDGLQLIEYIIEHFPGVKILVLTVMSNHLIISRLLELGVAGVIAKSHIREEIGKALSALANDRDYTAPAAPAISVVTNPKVIDRVFQSKVAAEKRLKRELPRLNAKKDMLEQVKTDQKL